MYLGFAEVEYLGHQICSKQTLKITRCSSCGPFSGAALPRPNGEVLHTPMPNMQPLMCTAGLFLQMSEHIPNSLGVVHVARTAPRHHTTICQNCIKREVCRMDLLNTLELIPDSSAVTTTARTTPRHNTTIYQTCSNGEACSVNLLNSLADP